MRKKVPYGCELRVLLPVLVWSYSFLLLVPLPELTHIPLVSGVFVSWISPNLILVVPRPTVMNSSFAASCWVFSYSLKAEPDQLSFTLSTTRLVVPRPPIRTIPILYPNFMSAYRTNKIDPRPKKDSFYLSFLFLERQ